MSNRSFIFSLLLATCNHVSIGGVFQFDNCSRNGNDWMDGQNWRVQTAGNIKGCIPGKEDTVRFNYGGVSGFLDADAGTVYQLQIGIDDRGGKLVLNPGAKLVVSGPQNYIGWMGEDEGGALIVNGGSLTYKGWVSVAYTCKGTFILNGGTVRVADVFVHNIRHGEGRAETRIRGGVLDVDKMTLNSGQMDISGGILRIRSDVTEEDVSGWIRRKCLTFNGRLNAVRNEDYTLNRWGEEGMELAVTEPEKSRVMAE